MQPQQPNYGPPSAPQAPPPEQNPYEFIMNAGQKPKASLLGGGPSTTQRIAIVAGGLAVLLLVAIVLLNVAFGGNKLGSEAITVAQDQSEIARVAGLAMQQDGIDQTTKDFALTTQLSIASDEQALTAFLQKNGVKVDPKVLAAGQNSKTDDELATAATNSTYDSTFSSVMKTYLTNYQQTLKSAYAASASTTERQLLKSEYDNAGLLLQKLPHP